ncbi:MAG: hypothetical protein RLZ37_502 [Actinomycetota bacterium]
MPSLTGYGSDPSPNSGPVTRASATKIAVDSCWWLNPLKTACPSPDFQPLSPGQSRIAVDSPGRRFWEALLAVLSNSVSDTYYTCRLNPLAFVRPP